MKFGSYIRKRRESLKRNDRSFSLRQVALRIGVEPAYLSKVERNVFSPPSEGKIRLLAAEIGEDNDALLAMAGKVSSDIQEIIRRRPRLFGELIRSLQGVPDSVIAGIGRGDRRKWFEEDEGEEEG